MAIQNKIYIGFESNITEWFKNPDEFTKQVIKNPGIYLIIVIKPEKEEEFQDKYNVFINQIYDKRAVQYAKESDNYQNTIEDLKHELEDKVLCNENTQIVIVKNSDFYKEIKDCGINCKSITEIESLTSKQAPKSGTFSSDIFTASILQRKSNLEVIVNNKNAKKVEEPEKKEENKSKNQPKVTIEPSKTNIDLVRQKAALIGKGPEIKEKPSSSITIVELEKSIFNSEFDEELNLTYSKLDDAKAELVNQLSIRLIDHINTLYPEIMDSSLQYQDYTKIFEMFNKALDSNTFLKLWIDKFPSIAISSDQDNFERIKGEAIYYYKICNFLYCEDYYDVFRVK